MLFVVAVLLASGGRAQSQEVSLPPDAGAGGLAAIHGVARANLVRMAGGHIVVTDRDVSEIYGAATTTSGPRGGWYQVKSLPAGVDLLVFVYHDALPGCLGTVPVRLGRGEYRELALELSASAGLQEHVEYLRTHRWVDYGAHGDRDFAVVPGATPPAVGGSGLA
ncbi:MAG: hypothetical protein IPK20_00525 [Betaproteobacteria bacterium]|nr:hypothetical protein [Betaproteobacteria bacterium]